MFYGSWGDDTVSDFELGVDLLVLSQSGLTYQGLTITSVGGNGALVEDGLGNSILLQNLSGYLDASDFIF